jgi:hypothetical protein
MLKAFLRPTVEETKVVMVSKRFKDDDGKLAPFVVKSISQAQNEKIIKSCTRRVKVRGEWVEELDKIAYQRKLTLACTVYPDFSDSELCSAYGVVDPAEVPSQMLRVGEFNKLVNAILDINQFDDDEIEDEAKN